MLWNSEKEIIKDDYETGQICWSYDVIIACLLLITISNQVKKQFRKHLAENVNNNVPQNLNF